MRRNRPTLAAAPTLALTLALALALAVALAATGTAGAAPQRATVFDSKGVQVTAGDSGHVGVGSIWNSGLTGGVVTPSFSAAASSKRARSERAYSCRHHGCADGGEFITTQDKHAALDLESS